MGMRTGKYMSVDGPSKDARRLPSTKQSEKGKAIDRYLKGGIDPQTGGYQAPAGGAKKPKKGPVATTGQPTIPGRAPSKPTRLPRQDAIREIVQKKMSKIRATPRDQLASQPIDRTFSA